SAGGPRPRPDDLLPIRHVGHPPDEPAPPDSPTSPDGPAGPAGPVGGAEQPQPLVAVLGTADDTPLDHLRAGQALQRVLLTATADGLAASMVSQPIEL